MRVSVLLLCLAVLVAALLPETSGGVSRRRGGRGGRGRGGKGRSLPNLRRKLARRGRQDDEDAAEEGLNDLDEAAAEEGGSGSGEELPNGCDPNTNIGGFLVFKGVKIWCGEQGITDFGPYGGLPVDGSGEASDVEGEEVEAPEEEEEVVRRGRKARRGRKGNKKASRRGKQAGKKGRKGRKATQKKASKGKGKGRKANTKRG